ncbi:MAG: FHA domain-containing protein, partial [Pseudomonadota bacterium]
PKTERISMTLFKKVFSSQDDAGAARQIRTSYDLAMAPEPDDLIEMDKLADIFSDRPEQAPPQAKTPLAETNDMPDQDAVAEAKALLNSAQNLMPPPAANPSGGGANKTRLLGFNPVPDETLDPIKAVTGEPKHPSQAQYPVGWIVVVDGAGRGSSFALTSGVVSIGRNSDQGIALDFGDTSISRENHAALAFDEEQNQFFVGHGGKSNIIRLNDQPVLSTEAIEHGDMLRIGETTLRLVTLCDTSFTWTKTDA